jgi:hypothetical protein
MVVIFYTERAFFGAASAMVSGFLFRLFSCDGSLALDFRLRACGVAGGGGMVSIGGMLSDGGMAVIN